MKKVLKWSLGVVAALVVILFIAFKVLQSQTKKHSPETTVEYVQDGVEISVFYNRPSKKGREIFGALVPYGEVWRTGANEATTFETNRDLSIGGRTLAAGKYTLWTIPGPEQWTIIFNKKQYGWGVSMKGVASRDPAADALQVEAPVMPLSESVEQFTISLEGTPKPVLSFAWDKTKVATPLDY